MRRYLLPVSAAVLSLVLMQLLSQRIGDELIWSSPQSLSMSLEKEPCIALQKQISPTQPLPPAAQALVQSCMQSAIYEFSAKNLERVLDKAAPPAIARSLQTSDGVAPAYVAVALFPTVEKRTATLCTQGRLSRELCDLEQAAAAKTALDRYLVQSILQNDDDDLLRALRLACPLNERALNIAAAVSAGGLRAKAAARFLRSCALPRSEAIAELRTFLKPEESLLPVVALEIRRIEAKELKTDLEALHDRLEAGPAKEMVTFALAGLRDGK